MPAADPATGAAPVLLDDAATGQLGGRDAEVNNIGSLLDPAETGAAVPEN